LVEFWSHANLCCYLKEHFIVDPSVICVRKRIMSEGEGVQGRARKRVVVVTNRTTLFLGDMNLQGRFLVCDGDSQANPFCSFRGFFLLSDSVIQL
jgi:hypothetical protein